MPLADAETENVCETNGEYVAERLAADDSETVAEPGAVTDTLLVTDSVEDADRELLSDVVWLPVVDPEREAEADVLSSLLTDMV